MNPQLTNKIHTHFSKTDPVMAVLVKKHKLSARVTKKPKDYFQHLATNILYQQLSTKVADVIAARFRALYNPLPSPPHKGEGTGKSKPRLARKFPSPAQILETPDAKMRGVGISWAKVSYIKDLANKVSKKEIDLVNLRTLPDEEVILELIKVKGIGRWTAEMFLMSALVREDVFSLGDLGLCTAIQKLYGFKKIPSKRTIIRISNKWSPYRTHAARLLWASLDNH